MFLNLKKLPIEIGMAFAGLAVDFIFSFIFSIIIASVVVNLVQAAGFEQFALAFTGAFIFQIIYRMFQKDTRKNFRIVRYYYKERNNALSERINLPDWAYDSKEQKSTSMFLNHYNKRSFSSIEKSEKSEKSTSKNDLKNTCNKSILDD